MHQVQLDTLYPDSIGVHDGEEFVQLSHALHCPSSFSSALFSPPREARQLAAPQYQRCRTLRTNFPQAPTG